MEKLNKILVGLLIAQVAVLVVSKTVFKRETSYQPQKLFADLKVDNITAVKMIDNDGKVAHLKKNESGWVVASAGDYPVREKKIDELLGKIVAMKSVQKIATKKTHHRTLEVADDNFARDVAITAGEQTHRFLVGSSPGIKRLHVRLYDHDTVHVVKDLSSWDFGVTATSWVDTAYLKVNKDNIVAVSLRNKKGTFELNKRSDGGWQVSALPPIAKVDGPSVTSFLGTISNVSLQDAAGKQMKPDYGLKTPAATLTITTETKVADGEGKTGSKEASASGNAEESSETASASNGQDANEAAKVAAQPDQQSAQQAQQQVEQKQVTLVVGSKAGSNYFAKSSHSEFYVKIGSWVAEKLLEKSPKDFVKEEKDKDEKKTN